MHLHVELFCWCSQHPPFGAESALGCSRQDQGMGGSRDIWSTGTCVVMSSSESWRLKLAGYPVYFENELIDYGQFPSVSFRVDNDCLKLRNIDSELGFRFPSRGANSGLTGVSSFGFGGSDQMRSDDHLLIQTSSDMRSRWNVEIDFIRKSTAVSTLYQLKIDSDSYLF